MALVKRAVQFAKQNGKEKAVAEFNKPAGQFVDRELYIVALDMNGVLLANADTNPKLIGKDLKDIRDVDNVYFTREEVALAKGAGHGWVNFKWPHPITRNLEPRSVYLERVDDYIVLAGVYTRK
ncbi:MAG: cache domain-containing protein [Pseudomonadota bacterium]